MEAIPAGPDGATAVCRMVQEVQPDGGEEVPVVVVTDAGGGQVASLRSLLTAGGLRARLLVIGFVEEHDLATGSESHCVIAAMKLWGSRETQACRRLAYASPWISTVRDEGKTGGGRSIVMEILVEPQRPYSYDPPTLVVELGVSGSSPMYYFMTTVDEQDDILARLWELQAHSNVVQASRLQWRTDTYRPGRQPGMRSGDTPTYVVHSVRGTGDRATNDTLARLAGTENPSCTWQGWSDDQWDDAVVFHVPRGAVPVILQAARRVQDAHGTTTRIQSGAVMVRRLRPDMYEAYMQVFIQVFGEQLGDAWDVATADAWQRQSDAMLGVIKQHSEVA